MKLDERILPGKRPLGCFDTEEAKEFIGKEGYFADCMQVFTNVRRYKKCILTAINEEVQRCFQAADVNYWDYFLPAEWLKPEEPEKKYRPFSLNEFLKIFDIGDLIDFKKKNGDEVECVMFVGYLTDIERSMDKKPGENIIMLGTYRYTLKNLFECYEILFEDDWQPFGVEEASE